MLTKIREIHKQAKDTYGFCRMSTKLRAEGYDLGQYRAGSLMKKAKVSYKRRKKFRRTTDSKYNLPVADNLLHSYLGHKSPNESEKDLKL